MRPDSHISVWNNCLHFISSNIDKKQFKVWFEPIVPVSLVESTLTVEVPSEFFREWLEENYIELLKAALKKEIGTAAKLVYVVKPVQKQPALIYPGNPSRTPVNAPISVNTFTSTNNSGALVFPGIQKLNVNPQLNPVYSFRNLIVGECNKMGYTAGENIAAAPGKTVFNPLFLFGGPGLGKTHIAQAVGIAIKEKFPELVVLYVPANRFKSQYMEAVNVRNKLNDFLAFYMKMDVLIVDDIQDLNGPGTQNAFFNIFNHLHQNGKQLIFTSDRAPKDLENFEQRLLSRMKWGLSVELTAPDYNTRLEMLRQRAFREGIRHQISDEVFEYLASRIKTSFRELEGALISLIANATLGRREITVELARQVTGNIVSEEQSNVTIEKVQKVVCDYFSISRGDLVSSTRKRNIVQARQIAMFMSKKLVANTSLSTIGAEIGGKDHATVLHSCKTVADLMDTDRTFRQYVDDIEKMLVPVGSK
ncbi:MAG: chromosomal replication initiator protein DnaA [Candidatus Cryptobacteroides sp.]